MRIFDLDGSDDDAPHTAFVDLGDEWHPSEELGSDEENDEPYDPGDDYLATVINDQDKEDE